MEKAGTTGTVLRNDQNRFHRSKPVVTLHVSISTLEKAKATGKGYTGFLSRLLDNAIDDSQMVAKSM